MWAGYLGEEWAVKLGDVTVGWGGLVSEWKNKDSVSRKLYVCKRIHCEQSEQD